jgi:8-oxo-dGTP diphosphatase
MGRRYPQTPVVGVAGIVLAGDEVLLIKRGRPPAMGIWSIPGGRLELGEELRSGCAREVLEETGIEVEVGPLVELFERIHKDEAGRVEYHYVLADFVCNAQRAEPKAGDDASLARWTPIADLTDEGLTKGTLQVIRKAWGMINSG